MEIAKYPDVYEDMEKFTLNEKMKEKLKLLSGSMSNPFSAQRQDSAAALSEDEEGLSMMARRMAR